MVVLPFVVVVVVNIRCRGCNVFQLFLRQWGCLILLSLALDSTGSSDGALDSGAIKGLL